MGLPACIVSEEHSLVKALLSHCSTVSVVITDCMAMRPPSGYVATLVSRHPASEQHPRRKWFCTLAPVEAGSALWRLSRLDSGTVLPHHCDAVLVKCMAASESLAAPTPERVPDEIFLGNALSSAEDACHCHSRSTANIMWLPRRS